jgi:hypothetical protein
MDDDRLPLLQKISKRYSYLTGNLLRNQECSICLEKQEILVILPNCKHQFCKPCIERHAQSNNTCPLCREEMICYLDTETDKLVPFKKDDLLTQDNMIRIISIDPNEQLANILVGTNVYSTYLTPDSPNSRFIQKVRWLAVGVVMGMAYMLYKKNRND